MNSAGGGAALSTIALMIGLRAEGIIPLAVCSDQGSNDEQKRLREATDGQVLFTQLYWWNRKIRSAWWKRPAIELRQIVRTGWGFRSADKVAEFAKTHGVDLIHTNTITTPEGGMAARRLGLPHVWHVRELVGKSAPFRLPLSGSRLRDYITSHASKVVANSNVTAAPLRQWLPDDYLEVVPNGIDIGRFIPQPVVAEKRPLVVAMVGSLTSQWKKHDLFVEAAARVNPSLPIEWRIYGHDPSRGGTTAGNAYTDKVHSRIARHNLAGRFVWPGFVADPVQIMSEVDIVLHPADHESFGRVIVEAMAAGLPVVGVRGGGVGEIVEHGQTGLLAEPNDAAGLAAAVERLAGDAQLRQQFGAAGRRRAEEHYSQEACNRRILHVYSLAMVRRLGNTAAWPIDTTTTQVML